ncbi:hypothetical protein B566_EDAN016628 [Ephemera danica]|nr:hypothetical protein B566_EDAN016628 [Ephemera danica]
MCTYMLLLKLIFHHIYRCIFHLVNMFFRKVHFYSLSRVKLKVFLLLVPVALILNYCGVFTHLFEKDYFTEFTYPLEGDITHYIDQLRSGGLSEQPPINVYNYTFLTDCHEKCHDGHNFMDIRLVYIVKSEMSHFDRRDAIRKSWGFEKRFSDVAIRCVFVLGINPHNQTLQALIMQEQERHGDIVQADFLDTYYNNTIKTMMGIKWARKYCPQSKFYFFSDDDMYVSTKNVLRFVRNPTRYPEYLEDPVVSLTKSKQNHGILLHNENRQLKQVLDFELPEEVRLYAGNVMFVAPLRAHFSKWYVPLSEYPFHLWPPYVTAGSYVLSRAALDELFFGSLFTKHFRFDDVYLALVALKAGLEPLHSNEFLFHRPSSDHPSEFHYVIACHGFSNPREMQKFWEMQREAGNA